jgi:ATP-dependent Lon protease
MPIIKATRKRGNKGGPPKKGTRRTRKLLSTAMLSIAQKNAVRRAHNRNLRVARSRGASTAAVASVTQRVANIVETKITKKRKNYLKLINDEIKEFIEDDSDDENENERSEYDQKVQRIISKIPNEFVKNLNTNNSENAEEIINNFIDHIDDVIEKHVLVPSDLIKRLKKIHTIILSSDETSSSDDEMANNL